MVPEKPIYMTPNATDASAQALRMTLSPKEANTTPATSGSELEYKDRYASTPPRKHSLQQQEPGTPLSALASPFSRTTSLHKRFLDEVTMSPGKGTGMPGSPCTPPRTPNRSPTTACKGGEKAKQTLEVGRNGFYFSIEIPEKKTLPRSGAATPDRRAGTPDAKKTATLGRGGDGRVTPSAGRSTPNTGRLTPNAGRLTPSPEKQQRSEVNTGGRVRDILKKNLFGTPRGQTSRSASPHKLKEEDRISPEKRCGAESSASEGNRSERAPLHAPSERATGAPFADSDTSRSSQFAESLPATTELPLEPRSALGSVVQQQTPGINSATPAPAKQSLDGMQMASAVSTPFNIGELMANHSIKSSKVQPLPVSGLEGMPTPLRKMSEKLGLKSPHVVRKEKIDRNEETTATAPMNDEGKSSPMPGVTAVDATPTSASSPQTFTIRKGDRLPQLLPSLVTTVSPISSPYPKSTVTTTAYASPATPSRPHGPGRTKSFGTPARLRSSMQEDMYKVQESLKRSLGPDVFQAVNSSTLATPSPATAPARDVTSQSTTARPRGALKNKARPVSMYAPAKSKESETGTVQAVVPRRPINTAARKPRPKSMVVGSAKMLETIASQLDSQSDRAKQRSVSSTRQAVSTTSRPGTAASTEQGSKTAPKASKPPPTIRTTKAAALRAAAHAKDAAGSKPATQAGGPQKKPVAGADCILQRNPLSRPVSAAATAPAPKSKPLTRAKSMKAPSKVPPPKRPSPQTPEPPRDAKNDSGTFERKQEQSFTPPGQPTRLLGPARPRSRTQTVDIIYPTAAAAPTLFRAPLFGVEEAARDENMVGNRIPLGPRPAPAPLQVARQVSHEVKASALQSPSKAIQSSLDAAIDRKIAEDREWARQMAGAGWF